MLNGKEKLILGRGIGILGTVIHYCSSQEEYDDEASHRVTLGRNQESFVVCSTINSALQTPIAKGHLDILPGL